jgi:undecaprenyl diphosphate synthase
VNSILVEEPVLKKEILKVPHHVAIMMDGNRRWAKRRGLPAIAGHWKGAEALSNLVESASNLGIKVLTVYSFSTENWTRPLEEINGLMDLMKSYLIGQKEKMLREGVRLDTIGDLSRLPNDLRDILEETKRATKGGQKIDLVLALNYGARDDIRRAVVAVVDDCLQGRLKKEELTERVFANYLDTAKWTDPELVIRTSGERRLSNFLLWQISYAEVYVSEKLWPDFAEADLVEALKDFYQRERRKGG